MDVKELKKLEGKKIYLTPTGNNARGNSDKVSIVTITKVARVFISLRFDGWNRDKKYRIGSEDRTGISLDCGHNNGYTLYRTINDVYEVREILSISRKISDNYRFQHDYAKLDLETLQKIAKLLEVE